MKRFAGGGAIVGPVRGAATITPMNATRPSATQQLPPPGPDALAHSQRLCLRIAQEIEAAGGWISFARYMELALYTPGLGYYSGGSRKFGPEGDFITAPELTPLFGQALARQVAQIMAATASHVVEVGAGSGILAADMLAALEALGQLPQHYDILELSGELRARQAETIAQRVPHLAPRVRWLDDMPTAFVGCVVANEVLDVMPVHRIIWHQQAILERGVGLGATGDLTWQDRPAAGAVLAAARALMLAPQEEGDYCSEVCLASRAWTAEWAKRLQHGALLLIDYGYPQAEYYLPSRNSGTLQCYYRHRAHPDTLLWPGLNDITSFVDFTAIAQAAYDAGLDVLGYTTQASFLHNCGLLELLAARGDTASADYLRAARACQRLTAPHEMGELFKVLVLGKGELPAPLLGLARGDRLAML